MKGMKNLGVSLPCGSCRLCCINDMILLHPEKGDDPSQYDTVKVTHPLTGEPALMLPHKPNGECSYLGGGGCSIYEKRPLICREYDCAAMFKKYSRTERRALIKGGLCDKAKFDAGRRMQEKLESGAVSHG